MDYAVVMAGGTGKRLWPLSRKSRPKQVLKLIEGKTLLRHCFERLSPIFDAENIIILTNTAYVDLVRENLPEVPKGNVIAEPAVRDTAGAIGLAAAVLTKADVDATMAVVTADQLIEPAEVLAQALKDALVFVNDNPERLVTFGIAPDCPSVQYGYIQCVDARRYSGCENEVYTVKQFKEKPDEKTAKEYIDTGQYFWNSGMFIWKAKTVLGYLKKFLPETVEPLETIQAAWGTAEQEAVLKEWFVKLPKISIDYAVMEKAEKVNAIRLDCRWHDLGAFGALADFIEADKNNNIVSALRSELLDCKDSIIVTEDDGHLIAAIGLDNIVVAHTPDATLVCRAEDASRLKELLEQIEKNGGEKFL